MMADEAVHIGPPQPAQSYLKGDVIIQAALDTGAEAITPVTASCQKTRILSMR